MLTPVVSHLRHFFRDDTRGTVAVEAAVVFPFVMWAFLATFVFFDGYRMSALNQKTAYTMADMLSREVDDITGMYIIRTHNLQRVLMNHRGNPKFRATVLKWSDHYNAFRVGWSRIRGDGVVRLTNADVETWIDRLPAVPDQERVILIETWAEYDPPFRIGMDPVELSAFVFVRLRFAPQLNFDDNA